MAAYYSTAETMEAIAGQIRDQLSAYVDDVVIFDGSLEEAVRVQLGQATKSGLKGFILLALSEDLPDAVSGTGIPLRTGVLVDIYVLVRSDGRTRYTKDRERLYDLSDALVYTCFDCPNWTDDYKARVGSQTFLFRRRGAPSDPAIMAHQVRIQFIPRRP